MDVEGSESYTEQTAKFFSTLAPKLSFVCLKKHSSDDVCDAYGVDVFDFCCRCDFDFDCDFYFDYDFCCVPFLFDDFYFHFHAALVSLGQEPG